MDKVTIDTYNKLAKEYDEETRDFWELFPDTILKEFSSRVGENKKILDLGSGPGRDGVLLQNKGLEVVCMDASPVMVEMCQDRGLESIVGDFLNIPFEDNSFDGVWAYTSLLHIKKEEIKQALLEIKIVLKYGGILGLGMIEGEGDFYRESSGVGEPRWFAFYSNEEIRKLLAETGFEVFYYEDFTPRSKKYLNYLAKSI